MVWSWWNVFHCVLSTVLIFPAVPAGRPASDRNSNRMLEAITLDQVSRGQIASILVGDFSMPISEDSTLSAALHKLSWYNVACIGAPAEKSKPTCHVGSNQGSLIDYIFTNNALIDQFHITMRVSKLSTVKDHSLLQVGLHLPCPIQTRTSLRNPIKLPELALPSKEDELLTCQLGNAFDNCISNCNIEKAFDAWTNEANRILLLVAKKQGSSLQYSSCSERKNRIS